MSIATRGGDGGETSLLYGARVPKDHPQIEALGAFDELNVEVGGARMLASRSEARELLVHVQAALIVVMGEIAGNDGGAGSAGKPVFPQLADLELTRLDAALAKLESLGLDTAGWATPGSNPESLAFDRARVAARRAERRLSSLPGAGRAVRPLVQKWANRLSDVLWLFARQADRQARA